MKNKTIQILFIGIIFSLNQLNAQNLKGGVFFGSSRYIGELNSKKSYAPANSIFTKVRSDNKILRFFDMKTSLTITKLSGDDSKSQEPTRINRNIHFRSNIIELANTFQFGLPIGTNNDKKGRKTFLVSPYIAVGLGVFYFNPQAKYVDGRWYVLQPLGTEGQNIIPTRKKYSRIQFDLPLGIGLKYAINNKIEAEIEFKYRKTSTDYIDDVSTTYVDNDLIRAAKGEISAYFADPSLVYFPDQTDAGKQRGDNNKNDTFSTFGISLIYNFGKTKE
jgi:hypothetical protein